MIELFEKFNFEEDKAFPIKKVTLEKRETLKVAKNSIKAFSDKVEFTKANDSRLKVIKDTDYMNGISNKMIGENQSLEFYQEILLDEEGNEITVPLGASIRTKGSKTIVELPYIMKGKNRRTLHRGYLVEHLIANIPAIFSGGQFFIYQNGVYKPQTLDFAEGIVKYFLTPEFSSSAAMTDIINMWMKDRRVFVETEKINQDQHLLNFRNGILNLNTWMFDSNGHSPEIYSTIQLNAEFDLEAECPIFNTFLEQSQPDEITRLVLQEMIGYCFTSYTVSKKMLFMFFGMGDTGKSTFINATLENIIPSTAKSNVALQNLNDQYQRAQIFGKIANINGDLPTKKLEEIDFLKKATGNDYVDGRHIYGRPFTYKNTAKYIFSMNTKPANFSGDNSDALYLRMLLFTWNNKPKNKDHNLALKLDAERNGIVQWALQGLRRLMENEFHFTDSEEVLNNVDEYRIESNPVLSFIREYCEVGQDFEVARTKIYTNFENFLEEEGIPKISQIKFNHLLTTAFPDIKRGNFKETRVATWRGLRLKNFTEI